MCPSLECFVDKIVVLSYAQKVHGVVTTREWKFSIHQPRSLSDPSHQWWQGQQVPPLATVEDKEIGWGGGAYTEQSSPGLSTYFWEAVTSFLPGPKKGPISCSRQCPTFEFHAIHTERDQCAQLSSFGVQIFPGNPYSSCKDSQDDPPRWSSRHCNPLGKPFFSKKVETEFGPLFYWLDLHPFLLLQQKLVISIGNCIRSFTHTFGIDCLTLSRRFQILSSFKYIS